jgi:phospholipase C
VTYPFTSHKQISPKQVVDVPFRPALPGLVHIVAAVNGIPPDQGGGNGHAPATPPPKTPSYSSALHVQVLNPSKATPVIDVHAGQQLSKGVQHFWRDAMAGPGDVAADWTIRLTNTSANVIAVCDLTVRYQTVSGNLGKIDHIVVLMMENRSFDQMLGYLGLPKSMGGLGRTDVNGLTGNEVNVDTDGTSYPVHHVQAADGLPVTFFRVDPDHGWKGVSEQLSRTPGNFVTNFSPIARSMYPQALTTHYSTPIASETSLDIPFRPGLFGNVYARTAVGQHTSPITSEVKGNPLCRLQILSPDGKKVLKTANVSIKDWQGLGLLPRSPCARPPQSGWGLSLNITDPMLAQSAGEWIFRITNETLQQITFETDITLNVSPVSPGAIMGYYDQNELPVYDFLARHFLVCDKWYSSLPTDTWPNRLYTLTGGSGGMIETPADADVPTNPPGYSMKTLFEALQEHGVEWNVFFTDLPFPLVFRKLVQDASFTERMRPMDDFYAHAAGGALPPFSWLEPNFTDVPDGDQFADDDHPPGDVARGQAMISQIYNALAQSPCWSKTLFLITYDEHGGFFDHVEPPQGDTIPDDNPDLKTYGARVPTFVISPWVKPGGASHVVFDHTSVISTVLHRFCRAANGTVPGMGLRAAAANDLAPTLAMNTLPVTPLLTPSVTAPPEPMITAPQHIPQPHATAPLPFGIVLRKTLLGL